MADNHDYLACCCKQDEHKQAGDGSDAGCEKAKEILEAADDSSLADQIADASLAERAQASEDAEAATDAAVACKMKFTPGSCFSTTGIMLGFRGQHSGDTSLSSVSACPRLV